jgi:hypothetical protein
MNPARGKVVVSTPRQWLTHSEIHEAFCSARLHLTTAQLFTLIHLVQLFSQKYSDGTYRHRISIEDPLPPHTSTVTLPSHPHNSSSINLHTAMITSTIYLKEKNLLHSEWLKRYLVHLRVHQKVGNWNTWMTTKIHQNAFQRKTEKYLATEFHKALVGREHNLTEEDLRKVIQKFEIIPVEILRQEIENRVDEWVLDTNGTRDYAHQIHREYKRHLDQEAATATACVRDEEGKMSVKKLMRKNLSGIGKKDPKIVKMIEKKLVTAKRSEYETKEKKFGEVTLRIFQKYDKKMKEELSAIVALGGESSLSSRQRFGDWLQIYIDKETNHLQQKKLNFLKQKKLIQEVTLSKRLFSSWLVIEYYLKESIKLLATQLQHKYMQQYVSLKRCVEEQNRTHTTSTTKGMVEEDEEQQCVLVTKETFLKYFNESFVEKIISLKETSDEMIEQEQARKKTTQQGSTPRLSSRGGRCDVVKRGLFYQRAEEARECCRAHVMRLEQKLQTEYNEWRQEKFQQRKENSQKNLRVQEEEEMKQSQKQKKAEKAYKKWLRLHSVNKYYSVVSEASQLGSIHVLSSTLLCRCLISSTG